MANKVNQEQSEGRPLQAYAHFLHRQAHLAGLNTREISDAFAQAQREQERSEQGSSGSQTANLISKMAFSKSHIDRLLKAQARPTPPWPFTRQFLLITSRAAGLTAEQHRERLAVAQDLLADLEDTSLPRLAHPPVQRGGTTDGRHEETVATLRLEVDLERARHTETRLRYALRNTQFLMTTLWSIISALRDIISAHHALEARAYHSRDSPDELIRLRGETQQAIAHKHTAHEEAERAAERVRTLEALWEQARTDMYRLSLHTDAADFTVAAPDPAPSLLVVPQELLAQPALDDIAVALNKARMMNSQEELTAVDLEQDLVPGGSLQMVDELAVLVAASRLTDTDNRRTALRALCRDWPVHPETKDVLLRLINDEDLAIRGMAVDGLVYGWPSDAVVRDLLIGLLGHGEDFDVDAFDGLARGWAGDTVVRDVLVQLIGGGEDAFCVVVEELAEGWAGDPVVRNVLVRLAGSGSRSVRRAAVEGLVKGPLSDDLIGSFLSDEDEYVRDGAVEALTEAWADDDSAAIREALVLLIGGTDEKARCIAARGLIQGQLGGIAAREAVIQFCRDDNESIRRAAARVLARGWPGDAAARDAVVSLLHDNNQRVPRAVARQLGQGWPGDVAARDALILLTQHGSNEARRTAARVLAEEWPGDATVHDALTRLTHDGVHDYVRRTAVRLLAEAIWDSGPAEGRPAAPGLRDSWDTT
ncbi:HEAT repeat domain-containing protein [Streptomyces sp. NPDC048484]|uniref:HEAT repeat domain-containing protein n=1 Tax=Streptomyces sp. NPDC048484 TaxID=3155146 RepID=UPI0034134084